MAIRKNPRPQIDVDLARSLDCLTEEDLCRLAQITPLTAEAWRKRGTGPAHTRIGNTLLYPRESVSEFLRKQVREQRGMVSAKAVL